MSWSIWHNPRCRKSRETLALLSTNGVEPSVRLYLEDHPSAQEIEDVLHILGIKASELIRRKETLFKELGLRDAGTDEARLLSAMVEYPKLIERPIVIHGKKGVLGRPPENVLKLL